MKHRKPDGDELAVLFVVSSLVVLVLWQAVRAVRLLVENDTLRF